MVGNTLKLLDKEIIVSYSDTEFNHVGIIYQATNFYYTGLSSGGNSDYEEIDEKGNHLHSKSMIEKYGSYDNIRKAMNNGANIFVHRRSQKHRYVYFNCDRRRKKELLKKLKERYEILPYPKQVGEVPKTSFENINDNRKRLF